MKLGKIILIFSVLILSVVNNLSAQTQPFFGSDIFNKDTNGLVKAPLTNSGAKLLVDSGWVDRDTYFTLPQIVVAATRTTTYTTTLAYANIVYNTTTINASTSYNTTTGTFTAPATGLYQVLVNNNYQASAAANSMIVNRIVINGAIEIEAPATLSPYAGAVRMNANPTTIVSLAAGQTITIQQGGLIGANAPLVGAGQHTLKIVRLL